MVVRGQRRREMTRTTVSREEVLRAPGTLGDALRSIQNLPGLSRAPFLSGSLIVRGSAPGDTLILVDGTFLPAAYHFGGLHSTIATEMLDRIDFHPGNFSARYGRATGGVVDVGLRAPLREGARTTFHLGVLDAGAFTEAALGPTLAVAASARFGWVGYLTSPLVTALTGNTVFFGYWDYQLMADWRPAGRDRVRVAVYGDGDSVGFRDDRRRERTGLGLGYHLAQVSWTRRFTPRTELQAFVSAGWNGLTLRMERDNSAGDPLRDDHASLDAFPVHLRAELSHQASARVRINVGADGLFGLRRLSSSFLRGSAGRPGSPAPPEPPTPRDADIALVQPAVYLEAELSPTPRLRLRPGLRLDASAFTGTAILSPRFTGDVNLWRGALGKFGVGYFTQPPLDERVSVAPEQLLLAQRLGADTTAARPERAIHLGVGLEQRFSPTVTLSVEGFYKTITDALVGFPSLDLLLAGERPQGGRAALRYDGRGRAYGLEVLLRHRGGGRFFGWVAYTLLRAERQDAPGTPFRPFEFDQTHILTAVGSVRLGRGWEVGARWRYVTGRPTGYDRLLYDTLTGQWLGFSPEPWLSRVPDFHQLDLRVERQWVRNWGRVAVYLEVLNAYNRVNAERFTYDLDRALPAPAGPYLPLVPNLGVRGEL